MGGRTKIWDIIGLQKESFYVFQRTKTTALVVFHQTNSVSETIRILVSNEKTIIYMDSCGKYGEKGI